MPKQEVSCGIPLSPSAQLVSRVLMELLQDMQVHFQLSHHNVWGALRLPQGIRSK